MIEDNASVSVRTLNAILNIPDVLKGYNSKSHLVLITDELITLVCNVYENYEKYFVETEAKR